MESRLGGGVSPGGFLGKTSRAQPNVTMVKRLTYRWRFAATLAAAGGMNARRGISFFRFRKQIGDLFESSRRGCRPMSDQHRFSVMQQNHEYVW